jgi:cytochrome c-type biogenesis protein CcsB
MIAWSLGKLSDLFSSVRFGIWLLAILFVYMSVGSAGILYPTHPNLLHPDAWVHAQLRQWRPFEMTEFEWFHWWPFDLLMGLIAANMAWTTLRRIPLRAVNLGVWTIHVGILTLIAGSVWYFGTKVEGDAPVARRAIVLKATAADGGSGTGRVVAMPGSETAFTAGAETWRVQVAQIDPDWELRTGDVAGERAYSVMLLVEGPRGRFMRQVIAGRPDLAEDLILTDDPQQPVQRAKKAKGAPIVETAFEAVAEYESQGWLYLKNDLNKSWALYVRKPGDATWAQRPIDGLPLYNDYVPAQGLAFVSEGEEMPLQALDVSIPPAENDDPFPGVTLKATGYLRYAFERPRLARGGPEAPLNPAAMVSIEAQGGAPREFQLVAFDDARASDEGGLITMRWADTKEALEAFAKSSRIAFQIDGVPVELTSEQWTAAGSETFTPVGPAAANIAVRVVAVQENLKLSGGRVSVAIVDIRTPETTIRRWIFDQPALNRDMKPGENPDPKAPANTMLERVVSRFVPGLGATPVTLVAGPDPAQLTLIDGAEGTVRSRQLVVGQPLPLAQGLSLRVSEYLPRAIVETRPFIVPQRRRQKDAREQFAMALVQAEDGRATWLPYHDYVFDRPEDVLRRRELQPTVMTLADGTQIEMLFSRQRMALPAPVALERFELATHVGGFTGETTTIRDYVSLLRFRQSDGAWSEPVRVSVNQPVEHGGLSFFQAQWDPPDDGGGVAAPSLGLNYTVLGVGSRHGVGMQLVGCVIAVLGMLYAFYVKPVIKRRALLRQRAMVRPAGAVAAAVAALALSAVPARAQAPDAIPATMQQVDLAPLEQAAIMSEGRVKSLGSFAFGYLQQVTGSKAIRSGEPPAKQSPLFTMLDLALRPEAYADADVIHVKNREVRVRLSQALLATDPSLRDRMEGFESHGLISRALLWDDAAGAWRPELAPLMRAMEGDLIRTAKQVDQLRGALALMQPVQILGRLRMVPVPDPQQPWLRMDESQGPVADRWSALQSAWKSGDAPGVQRAAAELAAALRAAGGPALPGESRLQWEAWYFRSGQMTWVWFVYFGAVALLLMGFSWKWQGAMRLGMLVFAAAFVLQTAAVGLRWYVSDRWPNSNMFEAVTTASWMGAALAALAEGLFRRLPVRGLFALGASVGCMVALMACALLPAQLNPAIGNMMPVLHDLWLYIHTNVIIFSYALIFMAAVTAAMYLAWRWAGGPAVHARVGGAGEMLALASGGGAAGAHATPGRMGEILDGVTMTLMELSFVLLWAGIAMGAIWADHSWGRPWGWDPKEVFALNTFVVFALLVHVRWRSKDKGLWTAVLAVTGAAVMLFNWIVINFVITGLHSYA